MSCQCRVIHTKYLIFSLKTESVDGRLVPQGMAKAFFGVAIGTEKQQHVDHNTYFQWIWKHLFIIYAPCPPHVKRDVFIRRGISQCSVNKVYFMNQNLYFFIRMTEQALLDQTTQLTCWPLTYRVTVLYPDPPLCNLYSRQCCRYEILLLDKSCLLHH